MFLLRMSSLESEGRDEVAKFGKGEEVLKGKELLVANRAFTEENRRLAWQCCESPWEAVVERSPFPCGVTFSTVKQDGYVQPWKIRIT